MSRQIVLLAPHGQVGFELQRSLAALGQVHCISRAEVDFADTQATVAKVAAFMPTVIVNAAAWTAVDQAEAEVTAAFAVNEALPRALAQLANDLTATLATKLATPQATSDQRCWLVHYSTDYVYPGDGETPWREDDRTAPLSVYGASKLAGDLAIAATCRDYLIFRTSWVYAARGNNFMKTMLKLAQQRESLSVVADQVGAPTPARLIANVTALALAKVVNALSHPAADHPAAEHSAADNQAQPVIHPQSGVYHLAASGFTNWYQFAEAIFHLARQAGLPLTLVPEQFQPIASTEYPTAATRPANSRLELAKLEQTFGLTMPHWQDQLQQTFAEWQAIQPQQSLLLAHKDPQ